MKTILINTVLAAALLVPGLASARTQPTAAAICCGSSCCTDAKSCGDCCTSACMECCDTGGKRVKSSDRPAPSHPKGTHGAY